MSNKLTKVLIANIVTNKDRLMNMIDLLWDQIQAHTAECVEESVLLAREELLKDHFKIGEVIECLYQEGDWEKATMYPKVNGSTWYDVGCTFRRPPKTRPMTDFEISRAIGFYAEQLSRPTLEAMANDLGISMEVSE
jgi:hypothetical protein